MDIYGTSMSCLVMGHTAMMSVIRRREGSRDGTPLGFAGRSSPAISNPGTPTQPKKIRKRARPQDMPLASVRTDHVDHMPEWQKLRQKCQVCEKKTFTKCKKCTVFLCYNDKRNCFVTFYE